MCFLTRPKACSSDESQRQRAGLGVGGAGSDNGSGEQWQIQQQQQKRRRSRRRKQVWDFFPGVWSLPSLEVIPQRSQQAFHLEVSESVVQPTPRRQMFSRERGGGGRGCFSPSHQRRASLLSDGGGRRTRRDAEDGKRKEKSSSSAYAHKWNHKHLNERGDNKNQHVLHIFIHSHAPHPLLPSSALWGQPGAVCTPRCLQLL